MFRPQLICPLSLPQPFKPPEERERLQSSEQDGVAVVGGDIRLCLLDQFSILRQDSEQIAALIEWDMQKLLAAGKVASPVKRKRLGIQRYEVPGSIKMGG